MSSRALLRAGSLLIAAQILMGLIGVGALRLFTELAPTAVFGTANLFLTALMLAQHLFIGPITAVQFRYLSQARGENEIAGFKHAAMKLALTSAGIASALMAVAAIGASLAHFRSFEPVVLAAAVVWQFAMTLRNVLMANMQAEFRRRAYAGLQVTEAALTTVCTAAALWVEPSVRSFMGGQALGVALQALACWWLAPLPKSVPRAGGAAELMPKVLAYGVPFIPISIFGWVANLADRYALIYLMGAAAAGCYVAPFSIASRGMTMGSTALTDLFRPILFGAVNEGDAARVRSTFWAWIAASVAVGLAGPAFIALFGHFLARTLLAESYRAGAVGIMLWIAGGYGVYGLTQTLENRLLSLQRSRRLLAPIGIGAACNLLFSLMMIPREGILGAAHATCASFLAQFLVTLGFVAYALRKSAATTNLATPHEAA